MQRDIPILLIAVRFLSYLPLDLEFMRAAAT
jgi:hypothetical protein